MSCGYKGIELTANRGKGEKYGLGQVGKMKEKEDGY
jgi:hypothetical protein